jgi:hypothetical protein
MKKALLTLAPTGSALATSAHRYSNAPRQMGRHDVHPVMLAQSAPESAPTLGLMLVSVAVLGVLAAYLRGRKYRG